jgi:glycerophosphoryl diester phosphodiesterase
VLPPAWLTSKPIAHRGLHDAAAGAPENSLAAFARAAEAGYPIELDVQVSRDGAAVVFHDDTLDRMIGDARKVSRQSATELKELSLLGSDQSVPLLEQVLDLVADRVPLIIELKNPRMHVGRLETAVARALKNYDGACAVSSFNARTVAWCARHLPHLPRGQNLMRFRGISILPDGWHPFALRNLVTNRSGRPQFFGCSIDSLPHPGAERMRNKGILLIVFTVRNRQQQAFANAHADNIFFQEFTP